MRKYSMIAIAGLTGAILRYLIRTQISLAPFIATLIINLLGSFLIALFLTAEHRYITAEARMVMTTGFLGAFTTFSTLCKETVSLLNSDAMLTAGAYLILSLLGGLLAASTGIKAGTWFSQKNLVLLPKEEPED